MTDTQRRDVGTVSGLIQDAMAGRVSRRDILRRGMALGMSASMIAAMATVAERGPVAAQATEIVFGSPYNLTGDYASIDNPARDGSELAAAEINAAGGVLGMQIRLIVYDGKSDLVTITSITKKLVEEDNVPVLVGLTDTSYMLAAGQVAQDNQRPFLDVGGTAPLITTVGDFIFMLPFGDNVQASAAAEFAQEKGWKTCALLFDEAMDYTKFLAQYFKARFGADDIKGEIVKESKYLIGDTDFSSQLTDFKNLDPQPDFLFVSSNPGEIGTIVKQARDFGLNQPILGGDGYDTPLLVELAGDAAHDVYFTTHQGIYGDDPAAQAFKTAYQAKTGSAPESVFAALGYDGVRLMADAITRAGSTDGVAVRDALQATKGFKGATGEISYEPGIRIPSKSVALVQIVDGKPSLISIVVPKTITPA
jgi:branched-chain amino acid transport system substrate-binding protein